MHGILNAITHWTAFLDIPTLYLARTILILQMFLSLVTLDSIYPFTISFPLFSDINSHVTYGSHFTVCLCFFCLLYILWMPKFLSRLSNWFEKLKLFFLIVGNCYFYLLFFKILPSYWHSLYYFQKSFFPTFSSFFNSDELSMFLNLEKSLHWSVTELCECKNTPIKTLVCMWKSIRGR